MGKATPSRIATQVARSEWGPVQEQHKIAKGIFDFQTAGHGGTIAVVGEAELDERMVEAARQTGAIEFVAVGVNGRGNASIVGPSSRYSNLGEWADRHGYERVEVWIGEEDCEYAAIMLAASPAAREATHRSYENMLQVCRRWMPEFLAALGTDTEETA